MPAKPGIFWSVVAAVEAILILGIFGLAVFRPKSEPITLGKAEVLPLKKRSYVAAITPPARESRDLRARLDSRRRIGKFLEIRGWAYIEDQPTSGQKVFVRFEKPNGTAVHYKTAPEERREVANRLKNPLYGDCGFIALIPRAAGLDAENSPLRLVVQNERGTYLSPPL